METKKIPSDEISPFMVDRRAVEGDMTIFWGRPSHTHTHTRESAAYSASFIPIYVYESISGKRSGWMIRLS
jgi:hypothetical protein